MDQIFEQVNGAIGITDDVVDYAKSEEHDKILHRLMQIAAENGFVFNSTKCKIKSKSISFFGMIYSENGVSPDTEKLRNVETGRGFPVAPVSIFRHNLWLPFRFGNLMLMSTKASSLWVILIQLNVRLSICSSASLLLYTASVFTYCFLLYFGW